jgi:hypothetical protein
MKDILKTRKTVQYYVWYNLAMIGVLLIIGFALFFYNPETVILRKKSKVTQK